jgi:hypothetical protein
VRAVRWWRRVPNSSHQMLTTILLRSQAAASQRLMGSVAISGDDAEGGERPLRARSFPRVSNSLHVEQECRAMDPEPSFAPMA